MHLPYATPDLPGTGGVLRETPEAFEVEEIPAYLPSGSGPHTFLYVEKRGLTTQAAVAALARALGVPEREAGTAGLKDRHARTRQWISLPGVDPDAALALAPPALPEGLRVLEARRHQNKLRTGHLRGNRFRIDIAALEPPVEEAAARARAVLAALATSAPNYYGEQRFGAGGTNADAARSFLRGTTRPPRDARTRRLLVSALQAEAFNRVLALRVERRLHARALDGDLLRRADSGGLFLCDDPTAEQPRVDRGEVAPTGPMPGTRVRGPRPGSEPDALEREALAAADMRDDDWRAAGALAEGTRRALVVPIGAAQCEARGEGTIRIAFVLPKGSYATSLLREIRKSDD